MDFRSLKLRKLQARQNKTKRSHHWVEEMPKFRETRDQLLLAWDSKALSDEEYLLLYDINTSSNPDFSYWNYDRFDLQSLPDDDCYAEFRFRKNDLLTLKNALRIPNEIICYNYNGLSVDGLEALCILLGRLSYPCRFSEMIPRFGRPVPQLCMIFNQVLDCIHFQWGHLLDDLNQGWLAPIELEKFARAIYQKGAALDNVWGFIDGTVKACCRPSRHQRVIYNGHKRYHGLKYQSVTTSSGMIANLYGPVEGKRHDSAMLAMSGLLNQLQQYSHNQNGNVLCIYGDAAYPLRQYMQAPFGGANLTPQEHAFNRSMSQVRVSVEWIFGETVNHFKFNDYKKNLKIGLSPVGKIYRVSALLVNAHNCLYPNNTSQFFNLDPPTIDEYFQ